ncbi:MAG: hypothetical protein ACWA5P_11630 [bacterium]
MIRNKSKRWQWWFNGTVGAILLGSGLCLALEASHWKHSNEAFWLWTIAGIAGIALLLSGIVLLVRAGILKRELDQE